MAFVCLAQRVPVVWEVPFSQGAGLVKTGDGIDLLFRLGMKPVALFCLFIDPGVLGGTS